MKHKLNLISTLIISTSFIFISAFINDNRDSVKEQIVNKIFILSDSSTNKSASTYHFEGIKGGETPLIYRNDNGAVFNFNNYSVFLKKQDEYAGQDIKIYLDRNYYGSKAYIKLLTPIYSISGMGEWFSGIKGHYAFFDLGTSLDRGLRVVNLNTGKPELSTDYSDPLTITSNNSISFYRVSNIKATKQNHPEYDQLKIQGYRPTIEELVIYNLYTKKTKRIGKYRPGSF